MEDIDALSWDESLLTGNPEIDEQHQELFAWAKASMLAVREGGGEAQVSRCLRFLRTYVMWHFRHEEKLQRESSFPDYEQHKKEHDAFRHQLQNISHRFANEGLTPEFANDFEHLVGYWLKGHVKIKDAALAVYLRARQTCGDE